jgi:hypothetical protein
MNPYGIPECLILSWPFIEPYDFPQGFPQGNPKVTTMENEFRENP